MPRASIHGWKDVDGDEAKDGAVVEFVGEAECGKVKRAKNRSNRKTIWSVF